MVAWWEWIKCIKIMMIISDWKKQSEKESWREKITEKRSYQKRKISFSLVQIWITEKSTKKIKRINFLPLTNSLNYQVWTEMCKIGLVWVWLQNAHAWGIRNETVLTQKRFQFQFSSIRTHEGHYSL